MSNCSVCDIDLEITYVQHFFSYNIPDLTNDLFIEQLSANHIKLHKLPPLLCIIFNFISGLFQITHSLPQGTSHIHFPLFCERKNDSDTVVSRTRRTKNIESKGLERAHNFLSFSISFFIKIFLIKLFSEHFGVLW